ncbi:hypothetical protein A5N86_05990 [Geobacillus thermoleovorans]|uniref:hypothetical protein n=1 Tax=Geobacillus thermoleovorans TaxID=33941 RepID=UPI00083A4CCD|nr:hypothetical protein [Geobacillus thermoleovorans]ODA18213.1 hypothetical protein A5N86_05990 [Geobacillus thermoleovorans]
MEVKLIAHTQLSEDFLYELSKRSYEVFFDLTEDKITDGQAVYRYEPLQKCELNSRIRKGWKVVM